MMSFIDEKREVDLDPERESRIRDLFARHNVRVTFVP
jgi:hypothetical protein